MQMDKKNLMSKLLSLFPTRSMTVMGVIVTFTGLNIFGLTGTLGYISAKKDFFEKYFETILIVIIVMVIFIVIGFLTISIMLCIFLLQNNTIIESLNNSVNRCEYNCTEIKSQIKQEKSHLEESEREKRIIEDYVNGFTNHLNMLDHIIKKLEIAGNIINKSKLLEIEKSVPSNTDIIIFSSKYKLDKEFKSTIINNIKRNITYKYIVSGAESSSPSHIKFMQIVKSWHTDYINTISCDCSTKKRQIFSKKQFAEGHDSFFYNRVKEYCSPYMYDILTIMLYGNTKGSYHVIVNLPFEREGYYSYILPENSIETNKIIDGVISMCNRDKEYNYWREENEH